MQKYIKNYMEAYGYIESDIIMCEVCEKAIAVDIHHIVKRSKFGKKRIEERDHPNNLIGLCREDHDKAESKEHSKEFLLSKKKVYV